MDGFLSSPRCANPNTRRAYAGALDRVLDAVGPDSDLAQLGGGQLADILERLWGHRSPTLWRMLFETAARANEILALNVENLDLDARRAHPSAPKAATLNGSTGAPAQHTCSHGCCAAARPDPRSSPSTDHPPARRPNARDVCASTGRARLGYDRARVLFTAHTGWDLHQLRHSAATLLGQQGIPLQLIMAKTRHKNPRTAMRYIKPGKQAVAEVTELLQPPRRRG